MPRPHVGRASSAVDMAALDGIRRVFLLLLNPFQVGQPRAVYVFVQDTGRNQRCVPIVPKGRQPERSLDRLAFSKCGDVFSLRHVDSFRVCLNT